MEISVEHKIFDKGTQNKFRSWLDDLFNDAYKATEGCDVLIEAPSAFAGIHIAESRKIPYLRAFVRARCPGSADATDHVLDADHGLPASVPVRRDGDERALRCSSLR